MNKNILKNNNIKKYGPLLGSVIILLIIANYIIIPSINHIQELSDQIFEERTKLEKFYLKGQSLKKSTEEYRKIKNKISELENIFIAKDDELNLITNLEKLAENNNIIQEINIKEDSHQEKMEINLNITGNYRNLINYLQAVESLNLYINFSNLNFSSNTNQFHPNSLDNQENIYNPQINLNLNGAVFYWPE